MTQGPKPRSGRTQLFSATHFYAALISWAFAASQNRCGDMRHSRRLPPAPTPAPPAPPAAEEPPVIPIPPVPPLLGVAAAPTDRSPQPKVRCGPGQRPCTESFPRFTSSRDGSPALTWAATAVPARREERGRSRGGAGRGTRPGRGRAWEVPACPARSLHTRGSGHSGPLGSAWSRGAAPAGALPAHLKYPGRPFPSQIPCFTFYIRSGFTSLTAPSPHPPEDKDLHRSSLPPAWNLSSPQKTLSLPVMSSSSVSISLCLFLSHAPNLFFIFSG